MLPFESTVEPIEISLIFFIISMIDSSASESKSFAESVGSYLSETEFFCPFFISSRAVRYSSLICFAKSSVFFSLTHV